MMDLAAARTAWCPRCLLHTCVQYASFINKQDERVRTLTCGECGLLLYSRTEVKFPLHFNDEEDKE